MSDPLISRIYEVKVNGYDSSVKNLKAITAAFVAMDAQKQKTDAQLQKAVAVGNNAAIDGLKAQIKKLEDQMKSLDAQREKSAAEVAKLAQAEKLEADAKLKLAQAEKVRNDSLIAQEKELDRQIALSEKQRQQSEKNKAANEAEAGSYKDIVAQQKLLRPFIQNTAPNSNATIDLNGQTLGFTQAIQRFKELSATEQDFRRQFAKDATLVGEYTTGIIQAFQKLGLNDVFKKQKDDLNNQLNAIKQQNQQLAEQYRQLAVTGGEAFNKIGLDLRQNITLQEQMERELKNIDSALDNTGTVGRNITAGIREGFQGLKTQAAQFALSFVGIQAAFNGLLAGVDNAKELSDQTTNLEVELGKAKGGAQNLVDALGKLNTRTKLTVLEDMANIAAKAGVSEQNLVGVTAALDKIKIAFGNDFGDVEQGTESLVKLINIFEGADKVTGENLLKAGNAVRTLANESVASVPYLNDFSKRMAGLKGIADISLPSVLGLASGFEQFGQSSEVAGTTLTKVIPKLATDTEKYGKIAGLTKQAFSDLLKDNPAEALIKVAEGLTKSKGGIEEISAAFADSQLGSGRIAAVLGTIGAKSDDFRKSIASAGRAYTDTGNIEEAFAAKNENLASTMDKISKKFADAANSTAFRVSLTVIASVISFLVGNIGVLIGALTLYGIGWLTVAKEVTVAGEAMTLTNGQLLLQRVQLAANNVLLGITRLYTIAAAVAQSSYNAAMVLYTGITSRATAATILFGNATKLIGIGALITIIALLLVSFKAFGSQITGTTEQLRKLALQNQITAEIQKKANSQIAEQTTALAGWVAVIKDAATGADTKRAALQKLIDINPAFRGALQGQAIDLKKLDEAYKQVIGTIRAKAEAEASASLTAEKQKDVLSTVTVRQQLETEFARGAGAVRTIKGLSNEEIAKILDGIDQQKVSVRSTGNGIQFQEKDFAAIKGNLKRQEDAAIGVYNEYVNAQARAQSKLADIERQANEQTQKNAAAVAAKFDIDIPFIKSQIEALDNQIDAFRGSQKELDALIAKRKKLQDQLDAASGKEAKPKPVQASRIDGTTKDDLKEIEAEKDRELALENLRFAQVQDKRKADIEDEKQHLLKLQQINDTFDKQKIAAIKGNNAAEQKERAQLELAIITRKIETNNKIDELNKKQFSEEANLLKKQFEEQKSLIGFNLQAIEQDPNKSETEKAQAKKAADDKIVGITTAYYIQLDAIAKKYRQSGEEIEAEKQKTITDIIRTSMGDNLAIVEARLKDIDRAYENMVSSINAKFAKQKLDVLNNDKLSNNQKKAQVSAIENEADTEVLTNSAAHAKIVLDQINLDYKNGLATQKQLDDATTNYVNAVEKYKAKTSQTTADLFNNITTAQKGLQAGIAKLFNFDQNTDEGQVKTKLLGDTIAMAFNTAQDAMTSYFDAEKQRIERNKQAIYDRIDLEKQQALDQAQSQAERDTIEKQAQVKKDKADRDAFEKNKKIQREQAKINLATQLSNLAVIAFAPNPANIATLGAAGAIMYAVQAALALAQYAVNIGRINSASYAKGGIIKPLGNGVINQKPNVPALANGDNILAYVKQGEVILNEEQQRKLGGARTFASIGVPGFASGGLIAPIGTPRLGDSLLPPVNPASFLSVNSRGDMKEVYDAINQQTENLNEQGRQIHERIDKFQVLLDPQAVEKANIKTAKQTKIGTL